MHVGSYALRNAIVGRVPDKTVSEAKGIFLLQIRAIRVDQLLSRQRLKLAADARPLLFWRHLLDGPPPEDAPDHGCSFDHRALLGAEPVQARVDKGVDRRWNRQPR